MTPKRTMAIAQQLYEGVDVAGHGTLGLITYMRTDSLRLSDEAMAAAASLIKERYGKAYYYGKFRVFKSKSSAQDAHEAIRPTHVELDPDQIQGSLTREQYKLYKLIWSRFVASQMANAIQFLSTPSVPVIPSAAATRVLSSPALLLCTRKARTRMRKQWVCLCLT